MKPYHSMVVAAVIPISSDTNMFGKMSSVTSPLLFDDSQDEYFSSFNPGSNTSKKYDGETDSFHNGSSNESRHDNVEDNQERDAQKHELKSSIHSNTKSPPRTYDENNISYSPNQSSLENQKYSWNSSLKSASDYCFSNNDENIDADIQSFTNSQSQHQEKYSSPYFTSKNEIKKPDSDYNTLSTGRTTLSIPEKDQYNLFQSEIDADSESPRSFYTRLLPSPTNPNSDLSDNYFDDLENFQDSEVPSKISSDSPSPETYYSHSSRSNSPKVESGYFCGNDENILNTNNSNSYDIEANFSCNEGKVKSTDFSPDNIEKRSYCDTNRYTKHTNCGFNIQGNEEEIDNHSLLSENSSLWFRPTCKDDIIPSELDSDSQYCDKSSKSQSCYTQSRSNNSCTYEPELSSKEEQRKDNSQNVYNLGCNEYSKQTKSSCNVQECEREIPGGSRLTTNSSPLNGRTHSPDNSNIHNDAEVLTSDDSFGEWPGTSRSRDIPDSGKTHNDEDSDSSLQLSNDSFGDFPLYNRETRSLTPVKEGGTFDDSFTQAALESHLCPSPSLSKWLYCAETAKEYAAAASNNSRSKKKSLSKPNKSLKTRSKPKIAKPATRTLTSKLILSSESDDDFVFKIGVKNPVSSRNSSLDTLILKQMDVNSNHNCDGVKKKRKLFDGNMGDINEPLAKLKESVAKEKRRKHKKSIEELICAGRDVAKTRRIDDFFKSRDNVDTSSKKYNVQMNNDKQCQNYLPKCDNDVEAKLLKISKVNNYTLNKRPLTDSASVSTITSEEKDGVAINRASNSSENIVIVDNDDTLTPDIEGFSSKPVNYSMTGVSHKYLERKFFKNTRYLHNIFKGRQPCWRHEQYKIGGEARSELRYATATNAYTDEQINCLLNLLVKTFCQTGSTKFIDYFWKVLLPEIATKIFMEKFDLSHKESLQKIHDAFIVSKNDCKQAE